MSTMRIVPEKPRWWDAWCVEAKMRLGRGEYPFGPTSIRGVFSAFALGGGVGSLNLEEAKHFVVALLRNQSEKPVLVEYGAAVNCADLSSGQSFVDPAIMTTCPFRPESTPTERLDILSGVSLHEMGHQVFSSRDLCATARKQGDLFFQIFNVLDDEFVEMKIAEGSPGYRGYLQAARHYMFGDAHSRMVSKDESLLNTFLLFVRYPLILSWSPASVYSAELQKIRNILTPFPQTESKVYRAAKEIVPLFQHGKGPQPSNALASFLAVVADHSLTRQRMPKLPPELLRDLIDRKRITRFPGPSTESSAETNSAILWESPPGNKVQYEEDRSRALPHILRLRRWLKEWETQRETVARGRSSGMLDGHKLHSLSFRNEQVFRRRTQDAGKGFTLALLIDESASMKGDRIASARQAAILLKESFSLLRQVQLFIYGHTADQPVGTTNLYRYWKPRQRNPYFLGSIQARSNNRDGVAIDAVAKEVRRQSHTSDILMLVISDGNPSAEKYLGTAAIEHTRKVIKSLRPIRTVHIGIGPSVGSVRMYQHHTHCATLGDLPRQIRRLLEDWLSCSADL